MVEVQFVPEKVKHGGTISALCIVRGMQICPPEQASFRFADAQQDCMAHLLAVDMGCSEPSNLLHTAFPRSNSSWYAL